MDRSRPPAPSWGAAALQVSDFVGCFDPHAGKAGQNDARRSKAHPKRLRLRAEGVRTGCGRGADGVRTACGRRADGVRICMANIKKFEILGAKISKT